LRRRNRVRPPSPTTERRKPSREGVDIAGTLESNLDRYPTRPAMLTFLQSLRYAAESSDESGPWRSAYVDGLRQAADVVQDAASPAEAVATLHGYQAFMAQHAVH
jgi:hypothetical protein